MRLKSVLAAVGIAMAIVLSLDYVSFAANGHSFLLGQSNSASNKTNLNRTHAGAALGLSTKSGSAPLTVNRSAKVTHLNADLVDGLDSSVLQTPVTVYTKVVTTPSTVVTLDLPLAATGKYLVSYSASLKGAKNTDVDCTVFRRDHPGTDDESGYTTAESAFHAGATDAAASGSGYLVNQPGADVYLHCISGVAFTASADAPIQVVVTRATHVTAGN
jgi:hypothetical protein